MTHKLKKWCLLTIAAIILPIAANADDSGSCGENVTYYYDEKTHTLTISGEGPMETNPWIKNSKDIEIIIINEGVTSICDMAFYGCSNITSVNVPNSIKDIYFSAFSGCSKLSSFTIPSSVRNLCDGVFSDCTKLKTLIVEEGEEPLNLVLRSLTPGCFSNAIEEIFLGRDMYVERDEWNQQYKPFKESQSLRKLSIGKNYTKIPTDYFYGCTNLTSVTFLDGLLEIGDNSFVNCTNISSLSFPSSLKIIGTNAFVGCEKIEEIVIPGNVSTIYPWAFSCSNLRTVTIEEGDETLKFEGNKSIAFVGPIEKINLRRNVECYFSPFSPSTSLNLTIGNKVTTLGGGIFAELTNGIGNLEFEDGEDILISQNFKAGFGVNMNPFSKTPINDVYMGRSIEGSLLAGVTSPFTLIFGTNISEIAENSYSYLNISSLSIPKNIKKIGSSAFMDCQYLSIITIEDGSESISINNNFLNSPLKELYVGRNFDYPDGFSPFSFLESLTLLKIGGQVTSLGDQAFSGCPNLKDVFSFALKAPSTGQNVFTDSYLSEATLHIIASAYKEYKSLAPWNKFKQIVASDGGTILYTLTYLVDGEVYKSYDLEEGASITPEGTPTKEGYTFSGWSEIPETMPANDVTITGTFTANKYKLTYMVDNAEYKSYDVEYGATITPEAEPTKEGYTFSGWSNIPTTMPAQDVTVTGTFTINKYKLVYMVDGSEYKSYDIEYGASITPEAAPTKEGYTFSGWSDIPETMPSKDVTVTGSFAVNKYTLTYMVDGVVYKTYDIEYGVTINPEAAPAKDGYTFSGWSDIPTTMPAKDVTITGTFTINKYKLVYMVDGSEYKSYEIEYGATITPEAEPTKEGYTFSGWSNIPETMPANDVTITGLFTVNKYRLIYMVDGVEYKSYDVEYGATITPEAEPSKEGYTFSGWSSIPETMPAKDVTVTGTFTKGAYKLTYLVDGEVYKTITYDYGATITPEAEPTKEGYTFSGWSNLPETMPAQDVTVTGTFTINKYKLVYMVDGVEYKSYDVEYGAAITPEAEPTKEGYTFSGWSSIPETMPAKDVTVTGTFTKGAYKLTYMVDGEVYKTITYDYGATITPEAEPTKEGYTFSGWSNIPETMPANDVTVYGTFTVNKYKLTYIIDGQTYKEYEIEYGASITPEPDPTWEGYIFSGWSEIPETMPAHDVEITGSFTQIIKADPDLAINGKGTFIAELGFIVTLGQPYESPELFNPYGLSPIEWTSSNPDVATVDANGVLTLLSVGQTQIKATFAGNNEYEAGMAEYSLVVIDSGYMMDDNGNVTAIGGDQTGDVTIEATITINGQTYQVTSIAAYAFKDNQNITSLTIPAGITTIGDNAFNGCINLLVINIGKDVQSIGNKAFANVGTAAVRTRSDDASIVVNCYAESVPQAAWDTFENSPIETGTLYVEDDLKDSYKATSPWNKFGKIQGFNEPVGINSISMDSDNAIIFDIQGNRLDNVRKGVNIIRTRDGKTKKMVVK